MVFVESWLGVDVFLKSGDGHLITGSGELPVTVGLAFEDSPGIAKGENAPPKGMLQVDHASCKIVNGHAKIRWDRKAHPVVMW
jgi:hypothetical protein